MISVCRSINQERSTLKVQCMALHTISRLRGAENLILGLGPLDLLVDDRIVEEALITFLVTITRSLMPNASSLLKSGRNSSLFLKASTSASSCLSPWNFEDFGERTSTDVVSPSDSRLRNGLSSVPSLLHVGNLPSDLLIEHLSHLLTDQPQILPVLRCYTNGI